MSGVRGIEKSVWDTVKQLKHTEKNFIWPLSGDQGMAKGPFRKLQSQIMSQVSQTQSADKIRSEGPDYATSWFYYVPFTLASNSSILKNFASQAFLLPFSVAQIK